jgi:hypothetical protein
LKPYENPLKTLKCELARTYQATFLTGPGV